MLRSCVPGFSRAITVGCFGVILITSVSFGSVTPAETQKEGKGWDALDKAFGALYDYNNAGLDSFSCDFRSSLFQDGTESLRNNYKYADSGMQHVDSVSFRIDFAPRSFFRVGYKPYTTTGHIEIDNTVFKMIAAVVQFSRNTLFPWALHGSAAVAKNSFSQPVVKETAKGCELVFREKNQTVTTVFDKKGCFKETRIDSKGSSDVVVPTFEENNGKQVLSTMDITHNRANKITIRFSYHEVDGFLVPLSATVSNRIDEKSKSEYMLHFFNYKMYARDTKKDVGS